MNKENGQNQEDPKIDYIPGLVVMAFIIIILLAA
jgi:hypothetical protein